jgi:hypothetical protein
LVGDLEDTWTVLVGHQPTDHDKQNLYRIRDATKLKPTDAVWQLLIAFQYYEKLYEQFPARIAVAARDVTKAVRSAAEAEARAAQEETKRALIEAVHEAAVKSAENASGAKFLDWLSIAAGIICVALLLVGWSAFDHGQQKGKAVGENLAKKECAALVAASSWANTPEGQLAYAIGEGGRPRRRREMLGPRDDSTGWIVHGAIRAWETAGSLARAAEQNEEQWREPISHPDIHMDPEPQRDAPARPFLVRQTRKTCATKFS